MDTREVKKLPEEFKDLIKVVAENARVGWVGRLALIEVVLLAALNPVIASTILRQFTDAPLPKHYTTFWGAAVAIVFVIAVIISLRAEKFRRPSRIFDEHSPIKGLLPFGETDREIFKQLQRGTKLTECYQAIADRNFRFGVLSGESGTGKTSFLQAGLWPALRDRYRCVYVKFTDLDPAVAIRQAISQQDSEKKIGIPETTSAAASLSTLLANVARVNAKPLVLLLDQFEQFFVHFKRESERQDFIRELNEWYRNGHQLPIKILVCIRGDFLDHLSELQDAMGYSLGPQQKFRLRNFRPEQAAAVLRIIASAEKLDCDDSFLKEVTERELAGTDDGRILPVDIQILAWMIAGQTSQEERAFNRTTFQKLGGVEGLLERFLTRALEARETPARRQTATEVLLALTDLDRNTRARALTLDELRQKLDDRLADAELEEAIEWLARGDVRLIVPVKRGATNSYELAHERLIPALRRIARKELSEADHASLLLDRRVNEWTGNNRDRRYHLTWRELRLIKKQTPFMQWEPNHSGKESLIAASWRQISLRFILASLPVLLVIAFTFAWYSQWGQLQLIKWDVAGYGEKISETEVLIQITRTYATMGDFPKALRIAEKITAGYGLPIGNAGYVKASALQAIAEVHAKRGEKDKAIQLSDQALSLVEPIFYEPPKISILLAVAGVYAKLGEKERAAQLFSQALMLAEKYPNAHYRFLVLPSIVEAYAKLEEREKTAQLLGQALSITEKTDDETLYTKAIPSIAEAYAKLGEENKAVQLLGQALSPANKIRDEEFKARALQTIAETYAKLGEKKKDALLISQGFSVAKMIDKAEFKANTLQTIVESSAELKEKEKVVQLLGQALSLAEPINFEPYKVSVLRAIAGVYVRLREQEKASHLLSKALSFTGKINFEPHKANALRTIAEAYIKLGEKEKATQLLGQALLPAKKLDEFFKSEALQAITESYARLGNFSLARATALKIPRDSGKVKTLALILEIWAKSKDSRLANERSVATFPHQR